MADPDGLEYAGRWFDPDWYKARNPDVTHAGIDPLSHYQHYGEAEGRAPSPWFDPRWYRRVYRMSPERCALEHFLSHPGTGQFLPCAALYMVPHTPPWRDGANPFDRYLRDMDVPGRELLPDLELILRSGLFDTMYYRINHLDPYEAELDPGLHYCRFGWKRKLRPSTAFDPDWYAATNPSVLDLEINPLTHYILEGEKRNSAPVPWFDPGWYRARYEVPPNQLALAHYLRMRKTGTVSPNPLFDVGRYVERHGASIPAEIDPFSHYLLNGALLDIDPSPCFDARQWRHRHMAPPTVLGQTELPLWKRNPLAHHLAFELARENARVVPPQEPGCAKPDTPAYGPHDKTRS